MKIKEKTTLVLTLQNLPWLSDALSVAISDGKIALIDTESSDDNAAKIIGHLVINELKRSGVSL